MRSRLQGGGLYFRAGPFVKRVRSMVPLLAPSVLQTYGCYPLASEKDVAEYVVEVNYTTMLRRYVRRQVIAELDQPTPFVPMAEAHAPLMLEMGLNWSLATRNASSLIFHAGVAEKNGRAVIIPGLSGQGKSTLSAGLALRGWRYLSDEFAMVDLDTLDVIPYPRPVSLKNQSIEVIRAFAPEAGVTTPMEGTHKGTVAYVPPQPSWIERMDERAKPGAIVFPHYGPDSEPRIEAIAHPEAFMICTASSVNYDRFGQRSFEALGRIIDSVPVLAIHYPNLDEGVRLVERIAAGEGLP